MTINPLPPEQLNSIDLYINFEMANYHLSRNDYNKAIAFGVKALKNLASEPAPSSSLADSIRQLLYSAYIALGIEKRNRNEIDKAVHFFQRALSYKVSPEGYHQIALAFYQARCFMQCEAIEKLVIQMDPAFEEAYRICGLIYEVYTPDYPRAYLYYSKYCEYNNENPSVLNFLGWHLLSMGYMQRAVDLFTRANHLAPEYEPGVNLLLFAMGRTPGFSAADIFAVSSRAVTQYSEKTGLSTVPEFQHKPSASKQGRKLHLGYLSGDIHSSAVMKFFEPVLRHHDRSKFKISLFNSSVKSDVVTERVTGYVDHIYDVRDKTYQDIAQEIHEKEVDILVEMSGFTGNSKIFTLDYRPAPVQVAGYIGYVFTSGLPQADYYLTDHFLSKPEDQANFSEKLYFLDTPAWVFQMEDGTPDCAPPPCLENHYITFGNTRNLNTYNDQVIETWSRVLKRVPNSRFKIVRFGLSGFEERLYAWFEEYGVSRDRIILDAEYSLEKYNTMDIILDCFPFTGCTTTCDAICMGLPTVTLIGETICNRTTPMFNQYVGLSDLIAETRDDFVDKAVNLAQSPGRLQECRHSLRARFLNSPLCDYVTYTRGLESAYSKMWEKRWENIG